MKKLMITLSAAALATSVFAADIYTDTEGFETYEAETVIKTATPTVADGSTMLWYSAGADGETGTVKAYGDNDGKLDGAGDKYLNVETTTGTPLYRKLVAHNAGDLVNQDSDRVDIGDIGDIYVDTYVQFTASEEAPTEIADSKLVVWVKETVDEEAGTSTKDLMVMAGQLNASGVPVAQNFVIDTTDMDLTGWHRLTIRAMVAREADQDSIAAFTLFLDGVQLTAKATQVPGKDAVVDEGGVEVEPAVDPVTYETLMGAYAVANLSAEAQKFYQNKQLFYSLVGTDQSGIVKQISAVGFDGSGQIDNVTTTTTAPGFARGYFTLSWDNGLSKVEVYNGEALVEQFENLEGAGKGVFAIGENMEQVTVKCTKANSEYTIVGANENGEITLDVEDKVYNIAVESTLVMIGDASYSSLAAALDAAESGATLTLVKSITDLSEMTINKDITINLNGNDLVYTPSGDLALFTVEGATLTIYDSVGEGIIKYTDGYESATLIDATAGVLIIGAFEDDLGAQVDGVVYQSEGTLNEPMDGTYAMFIRGKFLKAGNLNEEDGKAYCENQLGEGCVIDYSDENYFVITPSAGGEEPEPEEPTTFTVTVLNENTNASVTSDPATLTGLAADTSVTITATAAEGFTYKGVEAEGWMVAQDGATATYTFTVDDNLTVEVPAAVEVADETFDVEVTGNENKVTFESNPAKLTGLTAGTTVKITATAKTGYTYDGFTAADGWSFDGQTATYTATVNANLDVTVPTPEVAAPSIGTEVVYEDVNDANAAANKTPADADASIFKKQVTVNGDGKYVVKIELDDAKVQESATDVVEALGNNLSKVIDGTATSFNLEGAKKGLYYAVVADTELGNLDTVSNDSLTWVQATGEAVQLTVQKPLDSEGKANKGFFKVRATYPNPKK